MVWIGLVVGNSRFHWGVFQDGGLTARWDTPHLTQHQLQELQQQRFAKKVWDKFGIGYSPQGSFPKACEPELWVASVVPAALEGLASYGSLRVVERQRIPLDDLYESIGLDRALSLLGGGTRYDWPVLIIDCGTALTFTAGALAPSSNRGRFLGGAILPGLGLQFRALSDYTAQLPRVDPLTISWPDRWAKSTEGAIASGILHTQLAGVRDFLQNWWLNYPEGSAIFTGGDGETIAHYLKHQGPSLSNTIHTDPNLMFWGLRTYRQHLTFGT